MPVAELKEWGIPDWRDPSAYGDVRSWSVYRWRWEFFRRREDLRDYFDARVEATHQAQLLDQKNRDLYRTSCDFKKPNEPGFVVTADEQARLAFGYLTIPNPRIGSQPEGALRPLSSYSSTRLVDGSKRDSDGAQGRQIGGRLKLAKVAFSDEQEDYLGFSLFDHFPVRLSPDEVAVKFNLSEPLEPQIAEARDLLKGLQEDRYGKRLQKRKHQKKWLGYLRALDAEAAGASLSEMAVLYPATKQTEQTARDILKQAKALCFNF